jgi:hypothetical protein
MHISLSLIALAVGYKVFADAHKEKEGLKLLGQIIGVVVMVAALGAFVCGTMKCIKGKYYCPTTISSVCPLGQK